MKKSLISGAGTYVKNLGKHLQRIAAREEKPSEALAGMKRDAKKLARIAQADPPGSVQERAKDLVKKGREAYNQGSYKEAEQLFHEAAMEDGKYALAYTYLGNAFYQQSKFNDAIAAWRQAIAADPKSDAAAKAKQKLERIESSKERTVQELEDRLRGR